MKKIEEIAVELFKKGYSCSESVLRASYEAGLLPRETNIDELTKIATVFSGGMSSGCLCGAVAGAQLTAGSLFGRKNNEESSQLARAVAREIVEKFQEKNKVTCCRALGGKIKDPKEKKAFCSNLVAQCAEILEDVVNSAKVKS